MAPFARDANVRYHGRPGHWLRGTIVGGCLPESELRADLAAFI